MLVVLRVNEKILLGLLRGIFLGGQGYEIRKKEFTFTNLFILTYWESAH